MAEDQPQQEDEVWKGPVLLAYETEFSDDPYGGYTLELPLTLWPAKGDGATTTTLVVETSRTDAVGVPVRLRHFPLYDGNRSAPYNIFKQVFDTDSSGRLHIPLSLAGLEPHPLYFVTLRIEGAPPVDVLVVRRIVTPPPNDGLAVTFGFHDF